MGDINDRLWGAIFAVCPRRGQSVSSLGYDRRKYPRYAPDSSQWQTHRGPRDQYHSAADTLEHPPDRSPAVSHKCRILGYRGHNAYTSHRPPRDLDKASVPLGKGTRLSRDALRGPDNSRRHSVLHIARLPWRKLQGMIGVGSQGRSPPRLAGHGFILL